MQQSKRPQQRTIPPSLRPFLWSYDIERLDVDEHQRDVIANVIAYGDLKHWRELLRLYGRDGVSRIVGKLLQTELRPSVKHLAELLFRIPHNHHVSQHPRR